MNEKSIEIEIGDKPEEPRIINPYFDESEYVQKELAPRLKEIAMECAARKIPFVYSLELKCDETHTEAINSLILPGRRASDRLRLIKTILEDQEAVTRMGILAGALSFAEILAKGRPAK